MGHVFTVDVDRLCAVMDRGVVSADARNARAVAQGHGDVAVHAAGVAAEVEAGQTTMIKTGLSIEIPDGYFGAVFARSGLASRAGLRPANCVGVIDSDYRGEVIVALHNDSDVTRQVEKGERIAQLVILPYLSVEFNEVEELSETERQAGGFGSTGTEVNKSHPRKGRMTFC